MAPNIIKINKFRFRQKIALFDYDWTLVRPKTNGTFSKTLDDWMWLTDSVPSTLQSWYDKDYSIIIVSNQTRNTQMKTQQIVNVMSTLAIPSLVVIAYEDGDKKPNTTMFDMITENRKIDFSKSIFVGDARGRQGDWSDTDRQFAVNIGIKKIYAPDDIFTQPEKSPQKNITETEHQEIIVLVGYPGSGKSTLANTFDNNRLLFISLTITNQLVNHCLDGPINIWFVSQ